MKDLRLGISSNLKLLTLALTGAMILGSGVPGLSPLSTAHAQTQTSAQTLSSAQLQSLVSPIALYPDSLLSQVLMASTYPLEVAEAQNWLESRQGSSPEQLQSAIKKETWDNSVKSLVTVPDVLKMMSSKLSWTQQLGDAYLAQPKDVMNAVQALRKKAQQAGNLKSDSQVKVSTQQSYVVIEPTNPQVIYVPQYNPTVVYGGWAYPAYPPPPVYNPAWGLMSFGAGVAVGAALWSTPNWHTGSININNVNYNNFNRSFNSETNLQAQKIGDSPWRYNPAHRGNVPYTNPALSRRYGNLDSQDAISRSRAQSYQSREDNWTRNASPDEQAAREQARQRANEAFQSRFNETQRDDMRNAAAREESRMREREEPRFGGGGFHRR